ncbi:tyrosine-type recombinase/integrase [Mycobacteroides salmoniphilum]|uniref:Transposase n=1 Tax=Mycobacteroides salmoniphilum TaxID=404941 RepID=A0A4R8SBU5_9MYCO|nr:site-specific integrase [Mycobacteroides salmoniphilum]TDZ92078.1 Transposase [Mycobacteroides salmoniphilum]TEA07309.1 Transposase [Mycobacteroides salmoniphilum]
MGQRRTRGDGGLYKRGDGMWVGAVDISTEDGKRRRRTVSSKDKATALTKLRTLRSEIASGKAPATSNTTIEQWLTHWLETIQKPRVRPTTYKYYETTVRLYINPFLDTSTKLGKLTAADVRKMITRNGTRNAQKAHQTLVKALGDAMDEGMLDKNVAAVVDKPKHVAVERQPFTFDEARKIIATAVELKDPWATMWAALFFTGARQGEIIGMEWDRCDLKDGLFDFGWQLQQLPTELPRGFKHRPCHLSLAWTKPKTKAGARIAPMTKPLLKIMKAYAKADTGPNPHGLVWRHPDGHPISPTDASDAWRALVKAAGIPYRSMHSARHTTATLLNNAGVSQETRMKVVGHSSAVAQQIYVHVDHEPARAALSNLNELLS